MQSIILAHWSIGIYTAYQLLQYVYMYVLVVQRHFAVYGLYLHKSYIRVLRADRIHIHTNAIVQLINTLPLGFNCLMTGRSTPIKTHMPLPLFQEA